MEFTRFSDSSLLNQKALALVIGEVTARPGLLFCAATGNSPGLLYESMVRESALNPSMFRRMRLIKLDEWWGMPPDDPRTCEVYLQQKLIGPLGISHDRYISFAPDAPDAEKECRRVGSALEGEGPIGLAVLGLGKNGHLGLNEPGPFLNPDCHRATLSPETRQHPMLEHSGPAPESGLTLGMRDILSSEVIVLIVSGSGKEKALQQLRSGKITTECPATFLWTHPRVHCLVNTRNMVTQS